ncbi:helix-turn-helix domain-containing protein [Actinomycetes bacterium KLBMP 9759]
MNTSAGQPPSTDASSGDELLPLYTPAEAAHVLKVRESWLRRRAAARAVPCTFLGRHLRFSRADVAAIAASAAEPVRHSLPRHSPTHRISSRGSRR